MAPESYTGSRAGIVDLKQGKVKYIRFHEIWINLGYTIVYNSRKWDVSGGSPKITNQNGTGTNLNVRTQWELQIQSEHVLTAALSCKTWHGKSSRKSSREREVIVIFDVITVCCFLPFSRDPRYLYGVFWELHQQYSAWSSRTYWAWVNQLWGSLQIWVQNMEKNMSLQMRSLFK